ncbi:MAG: hypothetical protein GY803_11025 [Chloroflexi bacterium]|nr:hypothetical protein [Chloroflexota bacterium]
MTTRAPVLNIYNNHAPACGTPPFITNENPQQYVGYFRNAHGEQWVFVYDYTTNSAVVYGGDTQWEKRHPVETHGKVENLVLAESEQMWLTACWFAATAWIKGATNANN